ncbi:MAG: hypothetical protein RBT46_00950 [Weeksellaceae bacterium]|nr:hypothetical protein [Weeksellaceae bacterium]MDX9704261.1 hypothetical protein [Weeksellaceae bacterium]
MHFFFNFSEDIPEQFYSAENHQPHSECSICGNGFGNGHYFIEKAFRRTHDKSSYQMTFEYAICERCKTDMMKSISKESMKNIQEFAMNKGGMPRFENSDEVEIDVNYMLNHCIASGKSIDELDEYHLVGIFRNGKMVQLPMLYGDNFIEEYSELLSEETKDFFDDLFDTITLLPPTLAKILEDEKPKRPVLI